MRTATPIRILTRMKNRTLACLLTLPLLACASTDALSAQTPEWRVDSTWAVSVGEGSEEGHQLLWVGDAVLLEDGRLVLLSAGTKDLRVFSPDGVFIRTVGREGEGPGEFKGPTGFRLLPSGHLLVYDWGAQRVTEFDTEWKVVGTQRVSYDIGASGPATHDVSIREYVRRPEGVYEGDLVIRLFEGSDVRASIRRPRGKVYSTGLVRGEGGTTLPLPMGETILYNWGPEHIVLGSSHSTDFDLFDHTGTLVRTVRGEGELRPATRADMTAFDKSQEGRGSLTIAGVTMSRTNTMERFLENAPRGDQFPLFSEVKLDDNGLVWAREYSLTSEVATWQVMDPETGLIGRVSIPASWRLLHPSASRLIVVERDEYDVEMVRVYRVRH